LRPSVFGRRRPRTCTWTGGSGTSSYWGSAPTGTSPGAAAPRPRTGTTCVSSRGRAALNTNNLSGRRFNSILIEGTGYRLRDLGDNPITLTNGILVTYNSPGGSARIELDINVIESQDFQSRSGNTTLYFTGNLALADAATILTLDSRAISGWKASSAERAASTKAVAACCICPGPAITPTPADAGQPRPAAPAKDRHPRYSVWRTVHRNVADNTANQDIVTEGEDFQIGTPSHHRLPVRLAQPEWPQRHG